MTNPKFYSALNNFLILVYKRKEKYFKTHYKNLIPPTFSFTEGPKYVKVIQTDRYEDVNGNIVLGSRSSYCWIDKATGGILKGNWKAVEDKRPRGNIYSKNPLEGTNEYGVNYLK